MLKWLRVWLPLTVCPLALADGPWDGVWFRDDAKSHLSDHTYGLAKLPNGMAERQRKSKIHISNGWQALSRVTLGFHDRCHPNEPERSRLGLLGIREGFATIAR